MPIPVTVTITSDRKNAPVLYTYTELGILVKRSPSCILSALEPYDVMFSLDPSSKNAGWTFVSAVNKPGTWAPSYELSDDKCSLTTIATAMPGAYQFSFNFVNRNGNGTSSDPQEGNSGPGEDPQ